MAVGDGPVSIPRVGPVVTGGLGGAVVAAVVVSVSGSVETADWKESPDRIESGLLEVLEARPLSIGDFVSRIAPISGLWKLSGLTIVTIQVLEVRAEDQYQIVLPGRYKSQHVTSNGNVLSYCVVVVAYLWS